MSPRCLALCGLSLGVVLCAGARAQTTHDCTLVMRPGVAEIEPGRTVTNGWLFNGVLPGPVLRVTEGDRMHVTVRNELPEPTTVHWHGLPVPLHQDGVPDLSQGPIGVGQTYTYDFIASEPGTYWYHPHVELQIDRGLTGVLIVDPKDPNADPPFDREYVVVLDDWLPGAPIPDREPVYSDFLINGRTSLGQTPLAVRQGERVRLRFVNASGQTNYAVTVDGHPMTVTHCDGQPVLPVVTNAIPIGAGERYDVLITANRPGRWSIAAASLVDRTTTLVRAVLAYDGAGGPDPSPTYVPPNLVSAPLLALSQLAAARPRGTIAAVPDRTYALTLQRLPGPGYQWTIAGSGTGPLDVREGEVVRLEITNRSMHYHPMHLHGHFLRVLGSAGGTTAPLVMDTVLVPPGGGGGMGGGPGGVDMEFTADNPGAWLYHCHMIYHMAGGMMRVLRYVGTDQDGDGMIDGVDFDPWAARPVTWTVDQGLQYQPGGTVAALAQWPTGESVAWFVGPLLPASIHLGMAGTLEILPVLPLGTAVADASARATLPFTLPPDPGLHGAQVALQAIATHATLPPGVRLSETTLLTVR